MVYDVKSVTRPTQKLNYGRKKIILDYDVVDRNNVLEVLQKAIPWHTRNVSDCEYLINYFLGEQDVLKRTSSMTSNINNKVVVNYAFPITREVVGYTFGNPIELVQKNVGKRTDVETLSDILDNAGGFLTDTITAIYDSICGVAYQITLPSEDISMDNVPDVPLTVTSLHPSDTFCVFSNKIGNPQIMSCNIIRNDDNSDTYVCYTNDNVFTITNDMRDVKVEPNPIGLDPITMFDNSIFRTGDWEQAISVMNASNDIASDSLNDIEGTIKSLLVLLGAEFEDDIEGLSNIKEKRLLTLTSPQGTNVDAKFISPHIDSSSIQNIREYLEEARNVITGIPDRQTASGGDTGTAVLNRNGWTDIEIVARLKELFFKAAKKKQLRVAIKILQLVGKISSEMNPIDINITIGRHTMDNIQSKAQTFSTLVATGELATIDCLEMSGLTNRVNEVVERGEQVKKEHESEVVKKQLANKALNESNQQPIQNDDKKNEKVEDKVNTSE